MKSIPHALRLRILTIMLRPIAAFCIRHALRLQDLIEASKTSLMEAAVKQLNTKGVRPNGSRVSLMSGVHRKDVTRLSSDPSPGEYERDLITRVIGLWRTNKEFITKDKTPRVITFEAAHSEFHKLVKKVSKDINPSTVLFELERINAVQRSSKGLRLNVESHVPEGSPEAGFEIYARDASDLASTVEANVLGHPPMPHFHARTEFDRVRPEAIDELKRWFLKEGHLFHERVREILGKYDQDINPDKDFKGKGIRVVFGAFSYIDEKEGS